MPAIRIPPGVVRGDSRASVPGRWHTTSLVRWHEGAMVPVGGWERLTPVPLLTPGRAGHVWLDKTFKKHTAVLCDAHCYVERNNVRRNITPPDFANANAAQRARGYGSGDYGRGDYGSDTIPRDNDGGSSGSDKAEYSFPVAFSLDNWDDDLLFGSSADGRVWVWDPENPTTPAKVCANAPLLSQAFLSTEEHHLMVLGGGGFPNRVAWSDVNNREGWDFTRVEGQAGFFDLDGAGTILTARKIPGGVLIFTVTSVWLCTYIGTPNYYGFKKLAEHNAPLSPQAVTVALGKAVWMSRRGFWKYEGGVVVPLPCSLGVEPFEEIDAYAAPRRVCSGYNAAYPEIWFFYPTKGRGELPENNRYIIYNLVDNWWADGILNRTFFTSSPIDGVPFGGGPAGNIFQHEKGWLNEGQPRLKEVFAEVSNLSFDDGDSNWTVTRGQIDGRRTNGSTGVVPVLPNSVRMTFTGSRARGGVQKPLGAWTARADGWMDCRFTAKDFSFRVEGLVDAPWSFGATNFTVVARGQR